MRFSPNLEHARIRTGNYGSDPGDLFGLFIFRGPFNCELRCIASSGDASLGVNWEHVSVSLTNRCPNWPEMCFVKDLFWDPEECVMQLHPPKSQWISNHPYCLHLWRPLDATIPMPPSIAVGVKEAGELTRETARALSDDMLRRGYR
jgi:hypothetical protein